MRERSDSWAIRGEGMGGYEGEWERGGGTAGRERGREREGGEGKQMRRRG